MDHVEPGNPKKAAFILRTDETIGMLRASESHSLFVKVIQRVASFQKGIVNIVFESSVSQTRIVQMIELVFIWLCQQELEEKDIFFGLGEGTCIQIASISAFNLLCA